jgi:four helix bundle protein
MHNTSMQYFSHEKLVVYQMELEFLTWETELLDELEAKAPAKSREIRDHLDRAALSTLFNTAEGNGKRQMRVRARYFDDARGSATECAACLDALVAKRLCVQTRIQEGRHVSAYRCHPLETRCSF